jgi:hypothetical protein
MYIQEYKSTEYIKDCTNAVTFCFFDDFCSRNSLPASQLNIFTPISQNVITLKFKFVHNWLFQVLPTPVHILQRYQVCWVLV